MSDLHLRLTGDEVLALKFAAHRQLARWSKSRQLLPRQQERRTALVSAARVLADNTLSDGCRLRPTRDGHEG